MADSSSSLSISSMADSSLPPTIPADLVKLNGRNYPYWKFIMRLVFETYDLLKHVEGSVPAPEETVAGEDGKIEPNPAHRQWVARDRFALTCLMFAVTEEILYFLAGAKTSHEAWTTLETLFLPLVAAREEFLEQQWWNIRKGAMSRFEFISAVKRLADLFKQIGKPKSPAEINRAIVRGLGGEWEHLVPVLSPSLEAMSTDELSTLLLRTDARGSNDNGVVEPFPQNGSVFAQPGRANDPYSDFYRRGPSRRGPQRHYGPAPINSRFDGPNYSIICQICRRPGHTVRYCPFYDYAANDDLDRSLDHDVISDMDKLSVWDDYSSSD